MATTTGDESKQCRICLDTDNPDDLISPCLCSGGSAFIHRQCLDRWRSENIRGIGFKSCDICHFEYVIETIVDDPKAERTRLLKYYAFVIRDTTALILLVQLVILGLTFIVKRLDKKSENIKNQFPNWMNTFIIYYLTTVIILLALIGFIAMIILCRSGNWNFNPFSTGRSGTNSNGIVACVIVFIIIFVLIGLVVGVFISGVILGKITKHHSSKLWLRQEAQKYVVKDFQGKRAELEKYNLTLASLAMP
ncbi:unnamed protein product [Adineta steineri]|uniref:RING-CH-type domain-containing protein n=1 Tax=Adineta steineri TaxID=433720 RepID=A0A815HLY7_9BILA|nr:unnamed protein product [Adineta steineri]CAF1509766.1 unnamed protein product [Adineta steineri]